MDSHRHDSDKTPDIAESDLYINGAHPHTHTTYHTGNNGRAHSSCSSGNSSSTSSSSVGGDSSRIDIDNGDVCPICQKALRTRSRNGTLLPGCCRSHSAEVIQREQKHQGPAGLIFLCADSETGHRYALLAHEHRRGGHESAKDVLGWFGGHADREEDLKTTAAREACEETLGLFGSADYLLTMLYHTKACLTLTSRTFALSLGDMSLAQRNNISIEFQRLRKKATTRCQLEVRSIRFVSLLSLACFLRDKLPAQVIDDEAGGHFWLRDYFESSCKRALTDFESEFSRLCDTMGSFSLEQIPLTVPSSPLPHGGDLKDYQTSRTICPFFVEGWCKLGPACPRWHPRI